MQKRKRRGSSGSVSAVPTDKQMEAVFKDIVKYSKERGCPVTVHKNLAKVNGSNGYFCSEPKPHIKVALLDKTWPKAIELMIHEFCHFWQYDENFLNKIDDDGNIIYARLLDGETITPAEREKASTLVRISEYDCEIRTAHLFKRWNLESVFPPAEHIKSANTYNRHIVWSIGDKQNEGSKVFLSIYDKLAPQLWGDKEFKFFWDPATAEGRAKILAPISSAHKKIFDEALKQHKDE